MLSLTIAATISSFFSLFDITLLLPMMMPRRRCLPALLRHDMPPAAL